MTRLRQLAPLVQQAGLKISRELGFQLSDRLTEKMFADRSSTVAASIA
jgi:hypothetical protein